MRIKIVGLGTVRFKSRAKPPKVIIAEVRPALTAMSAGAKFGDNYTPGSYVSLGGSVVSQTSTFLVNEQVRDENHIAAVGETLRVSVVVVDDSNNFKVFSTLALPVVPVEGAPRIAGLPQPGQTLTAVSFSFPGVAPFTYEFQWQSALANIPGATAISYVLTPAEATKEVRVGMRARDSQGTLSAWVFSESVTVDFAAPVFSVQPFFDNASYSVGSVVTVNIGTATAPITVTGFTVDGVTKPLTQVSATTFTWNSTGTLPGAIRLTAQAVNSSGITPSTPATAALTQAPIVTPSQFAGGDWSVANEGTGGKARFTIISLPSNGGSPATAIQYQIGAGAFVTSGLLAPGVFDVAGFVNGVATDTSIRMVNSAGNGTAAVVKSVTVSDITAPETLPLLYDTPTNAVTVSTTEAAKKYYLVNTAATPLTGAAIKAAVGAATPLVFGTINIGVTEVTPAMGGLVTGIYWLHIASEDAAVNVEAIGEVIEFEWTGAADVTAPVLSLPTGAANGSTASTGTVTTANDANGTLYAIDSTSATPATAVQIIAGQMHTGAAAASSGSQAVTATGIQSVARSGLLSSTTYFRHYVHKDAAGNNSNVVVSAGFTTAAPSVGVDFVSSTLMITSSSTGQSFNSTTDHTVSANANRSITLMIRGTWDTVGPPTITTCTFGGVDATIVQVPTGTAGKAWNAIAVVTAPATGARGCSLVLSASQRAISVRAIECKNVNQSTPTEANGSVSDAVDTTLSFTRTTAANGAMLLSTINLDSGGLQAEITAISGATLIASEQTGTTGSSDHSTGAAYEAVPTAGANGHGYNWTTSDASVVAWVEMKAV